MRKSMSNITSWNQKSHLFLHSITFLGFEKKLTPKNLKKCLFRAQVAPLIINLEHFWGHIQIPHWNWVQIGGSHVQFFHLSHFWSFLSYTCICMEKLQMLNECVYTVWPWYNGLEGTGYFYLLYRGTVILR